MSLQRKYFWIVGLGFAILSMILLYIGIRWVLGNDLIPRNLLTFAIFSLVVGIIAASLMFLQWKITFWVFSLGFIIGFIDMYRAFLNGMSGWGDLVGLMSLFMWIITGLGAGIILQLGFHLYKRIRK